MCGIAGVLSAEGRPGEATLRSMAATIDHRGPDDSAWATDAGCGMVATRLALLDPGPTGAQPWTSGHRVLAFNGEIYNHDDLRVDLTAEGVDFVGSSDTEVLFHLLDRRGVSATLQTIRGMFAFSWWDGTTLSLARDRFGIKPLVWTRVGTVLAWASEAKALAVVAPLRPDPTAALFSLLSQADRAATRTPFTDVWQVPPGHVVSVRPGEVPSTSRYFDLLDLVDPDLHHELAAMGPVAVAERFADLLDAAVASMVVADAPMGTFVSGGVDSSLLAALAVEHDHDHQLFTADVEGRSEAPAAVEVARHLGHPLTTGPFRIDDVLGDLASTTWHYEAPIVTHMNALPLHRVARAARDRCVKAVLTGEGADELFLGYADAPFRRYRRVLRSPVLAVHHLYDRFPGLAGKVLPELADGRTQFVADVAGDFQEPRARRRAVAAFDFLPPGEADEQATTATLFAGHLLTLLHRNDRMGMQASIECRFPYLDHEVVRFGLNLPTAQKLRWSGAVSDRKHPFVMAKAPVRAAAAARLPKELAHRPKDGFPSYGHADLRVDPTCFEGGWVAEAFGLSLDGLHHLVGHESPYFAAKLVSVEVFGRLFGRGDSAESVTEHIRRHVVLDP